jgi:hypothetical protein
MTKRMRESNSDLQYGEVRYRAFGHGEPIAYFDGDLSQLDAPLGRCGPTIRLATASRAAKHELALEE